MAAGFTSVLRDAILSLEAMIPSPGSEETSLKAWGEDFLRKIGARFSLSRGWHYC